MRSMALKGSTRSRVSSLQTSPIQSKNINKNKPRESSHHSRRNSLPFLGVWLLVLLGCYLAIKSIYFSDEDDNAAFEILLGTAVGQTLKGTGNDDPSHTPVKIAYAITISHCPPKQEHSDWVKVLDGPAVLAHSIHQNSRRGTNNHRRPGRQSRYDYQLYAFVHPDASSCTQHLSTLNYTVVVYETPFNVTKIKQKVYRDRVQQQSAGCCKEKEFLKLYSYTLSKYPLVVHLDADTLILNPMDTLYDILLNETSENTTLVQNFGSHAQWPSQNVVTSRVHSLFTRDYPMGNPKTFEIKHFGMQGGFWIVRPNKTAFDEMVHLILEGNFSAGWYDGSTKFKGFYGAAMIQGLVGFYYSHIHPGHAVELDRCLYNNMADDPWEHTEGICRVPTEPGQPPSCQDCRHMEMSKVYSTHFTMCGKPWWCKHHNPQHINSSLCHTLTKEWFATRLDLEAVSWGRSSRVDNATDDPFLGYCGPKHRRYQMMQFPSPAELST